jgi:hypothetical protein
VDAEDLFLRYFFPLYPPDARTATDLARARSTDANPGRNRFILAHIEDASDRFVRGAGQLFGTDLGLDLSDASVHRLSAALSADVRDSWASRGDPGTADNVLFNATVHGTAYVGSCIVAQHGGAWSVRRPLWESVVQLRSRAGQADLAIFHWWLKALAGDAQGTTLADRYRAHVEVPCARPEELPVLVAVDRPLPRLNRPRYDTLHKYLRAHLPELRDLGQDFPSPERFESFSLQSIDVRLLGGGRMVLLSGLSSAGLHLFWLSAAGFEKSLFVACDPFPSPVLRVEGDRLILLTREGGRDETREMLWWGP